MVQVNETCTSEKTYTIYTEYNLVFKFSAAVWKALYFLLSIAMVQVYKKPAIHLCTLDSKLCPFCIAIWDAIPDELFSDSLNEFTQSLGLPQSNAQENAMMMSPRQFGRRTNPHQPETRSFLPDDVLMVSKSDGRVYIKIKFLFSPPVNFFQKCYKVIKKSKKDNGKAI